MEIRYIVVISRLPSAIIGRSLLTWPRMQTAVAGSVIFLTIQFSGMNIYSLLVLTLSIIFQFCWLKCCIIKWNWNICFKSFAKCEKSGKVFNKFSVNIFHCMSILVGTTSHPDENRKNSVVYLLISLLNNTVSLLILLMMWHNSEICP